MIDRDLENKITQLKEFTDLWASFHASYKKASKQQSFTDDEEAIFLELKSSLARKYQGLMDSLGIKASAEDRTFDVISQVMSLKGMCSLSPMQFDKVDNDWHASYITLNKILGSLENRQNELAKINPAVQACKKFFTNPIFTLILIVIVIGFIYYVIKTFFS